MNKNRLNWWDTYNEDEVGMPGDHPYMIELSKGLGCQFTEGVGAKDSYLLYVGLGLTAVCIMHDNEKMLVQLGSSEWVIDSLEGVQRVVEDLTQFSINFFDTVSLIRNTNEEE